jgi:hypothetical protein
MISENHPEDPFVVLRQTKVKMKQQSAHYKLVFEQPKLEKHGMIAEKTFLRPIGSDLETLS